MGKIRNEEMFFREEVTGHHHGQTDITLTALLKNESAVEWGMTTEDGHKQKNSITYILESKEVINQLKDLESMTDEIRRIEQQIDRASEADIIDSAMNMQLNLLSEEWNTLNNKIVDMENELHEKKPYKTYIRQ